MLKNTDEKHGSNKSCIFYFLKQCMSHLKTNFMLMRPKRTNGRSLPIYTVGAKSMSPVQFL